MVGMDERSAATVLQDRCGVCGMGGGAADWRGRSGHRCVTRFLRDGLAVAF